MNVYFNMYICINKLSFLGQCVMRGVGCHIHSIFKINKKI